MTTEQTRIHAIIAVIALLISCYFSLFLAVRLTTGEQVYIWNIFPYITSFSFFSWIVIIICIIISAFITQVICEILCLVILSVYCTFNKDSELYDDFEIKIMTGESRKYRSSGLSRRHHREESSCRSSALSRRHHSEYDDDDDDM